MALTVLGGCGGGQEDTYCSTLREEKQVLTGLAAQSRAARTDVLTPTLAAFQRLQKVAPPELADEYQTVVFAYQDLVAAVRRAGIDQRGYRPGSRPPGLTDREARQLGAVAAKLASSRVTEAVAGIEQQADQVCGVRFGA